MKISELVRLLEKAKEEYGDVSIYFEKDGGYCQAEISSLYDYCGEPVLSSYRGEDENF